MPIGTQQGEHTFPSVRESDSRYLNLDVDTDDSHDLSTRANIHGSSVHERQHTHSETSVVS